MYKVFNQLNSEVHNYVNSNDRGHVGAEEKSQIYEAHMRLSHNMREETKSNDTDFKHYTHVKPVKKDAGLVTRNQIFLQMIWKKFSKVLNGYYYDDESW